MRTQQPCKSTGQESLVLKNLAAYLFPRESVIGLLLPLALVALFWLVEVSK